MIVFLVLVRVLFFISPETLLLWLYFDPRPNLIWCPLHGFKWPEIKKGLKIDLKTIFDHEGGLKWPQIQKNALKSTYNQFLTIKGAPD